MPKFEFRKINDPNVKFDYRTRTYERTIMVPKIVKAPLWDADNNRLSLEELQNIGLEILYTPDPSQEELDYDMYTQMYANNPQLATRIEEYKGYLDQLSVPVTANSTQIDAAIQANETLSDTEKLELAQRISTCFHDILVNVQALGIMMTDFEIWANMEKFVYYLPSNNPPEPERTQSVVLTPELEQQLKEQGIL